MTDESNVAPRPLVNNWPLWLLLTAMALLVADDLFTSRGVVDSDLLTDSLLVAMGVGSLVLVFGVPRSERLKAGAARMALGVAVSVVTTVLALVAAEFATRRLYRDITTTSDDRGYFSARWQRASVVVNGFGYRERAVTPAKPAGVYRIAVVGDSFAYGNGIDADARFSAVMQHALGDGFEVLNFGMPGHNTPEIVGEVAGPVRQFHPDFVLAQWFVNDVEGTARTRPTYQRLIPFSGVHERLQHDSAFYSLLDSWWIRRQVAGLRPGSYADYLKTRYGDSASPDWQAHLAALGALVAAARAQGADLGMVLFPDTSYDLGAGYPLAFLHERVLGFCAAQRLTCIDLRPVFAGVKARQALWANRLDAHPSAQANALAAGEILRALESRWLTARAQ